MAASQTKPPPLLRSLNHGLVTEVRGQSSHSRGHPRGHSCRIRLCHPCQSVPPGQSRGEHPPGAHPLRSCHPGPGPLPPCPAPEGPQATAQPFASRQSKARDHPKPRAACFRPNHSPGLPPFVCFTLIWTETTSRETVRQLLMVPWGPQPDAPDASLER